MHDLIESFCEEYGYQFYPDYSGRYMFGNKCVGFVCDNVNVAIDELRGYLRDYEEFEFADNISKLSRSDNLGLSIILYFPSIL